ncbi:MAG: AmmeMemoRadiSam system protein B, partial [bacterium]|nr:AmmeMemoRadiSam system protein B [bacterium]
MTKKRIHLLAACMLVAAVCVLGATSGPRIRWPVGAGVWYPADAQQLHAAVQQYMNDADVVPLPGKVVACIAPNASYGTSGAVAGSAFAALKPGDYDRVIVLAPSNHASFRACSIPGVHYYRTPLGDIPLDGEIIKKLTLSTVFTLRSVVYRKGAYSDPEIRRQAVHEREHAIEVVLPFLQARLGKFKLVPILMGNLNGYRGRFDQRAFETIVKRLREVIDDRTLLVVSTDFTRYGPQYGFTPFNDNVQSRIAALDLKAFGLIQNRDIKGLRTYIKETKNRLPGALCLITLMATLDP